MKKSKQINKALNHLYLALETLEKSGVFKRKDARIGALEDIIEQLEDEHFHVSMEEKYA